jgi:hypothetical protein
MTITLDDDVAAHLRGVMRARGLTFNEAVDSTLRAGLVAEREPRRYRLPTYRMGVRADIALDSALHLDAAMEDMETVRQLRPGT